MGIHCDIFLNKPAEGVHKAGQAISGVVKYAVDEPTEFQDIILSLIGDASCYMRKQDHNYYGKETFINRHINILDKKADEAVIVPTGYYEFPFEFILPRDIPSSYQSHSKFLSNSPAIYRCNINYSVIVKAIPTSFFSFSRKFKSDVIVYGNVNPIAPDGPIIAGLEKSLFSLFASKENVIRLKGQVKKSFLRPGESAELTFELKNDSDIEINHIKVGLHQRISLETNYGKRESIEKAVDGCSRTTKSIANNTELNFSCVIPTLPELYSIQHSKVIFVDYIIKAVVVLPLPHLNASFEIPLAIGEGFNDTQAEIRVLDDDDDDDDDPPPSYWESVSGGKFVNADVTIFDTHRP